MPSEAFEEPIDNNMEIERADEIVNLDNEQDMVTDVQDVESDTLDTLVQNPSEEQYDGALHPVEHLLAEDEDEEDEDEEDEVFDNNGQRIRPSHAQTVPLPFPPSFQGRPSQTQTSPLPTSSPSANSSASSSANSSVPSSPAQVQASTLATTTPTNSSQTPSPESDRRAPTPPLPSPAPTTSLPSTAPSTAASGSRHSSSIGKGGRRLVCQGNRLVKKKLTPEETANLKQDWRRYIQGLKNELNKELSKDPLAEKLHCSRCEKLVTRAGYIRHHTLQGCRNMNPQVKWGNYVNIFQNKYQN